MKFFDVNDLSDFIVSKMFIENHQIEDNFNLLLFLQKRHFGKDKEGRNWNEKLCEIPFIFNEDVKLCCPNKLLFRQHPRNPDNSITIHKQVAEKIYEKTVIYNWLKNLGTEEPTDYGLIEVIANQSETYINSANAIQTIRFLFECMQNGRINHSQFEKLKKVKLLTKIGTLLCAEECFLSNFYKPDLELEGTSDSNIFVSGSYLWGQELKSEWKTFFEKIGVSQTLAWVVQKMPYYTNMHYKPYFDLERGYPNMGFPNPVLYYKLSKISFVKLCINNYNFGKVFWKIVLSANLNTCNYGFADMSNTFFYGWRNLSIKPYFEWVIENREIIPTTQKKSLKASEVYINKYREIAGKYLPVFDYEGAIPSDWQEYLKFQPLKIGDYLDILHKISQDTTTTDEEKAENKKRILAIYKILAEDFKAQTDQNTINIWAKGKKFLAKDGKFYADIAYILEEGFKADNIVYTGDTKLSKEDLKYLFGLFGIKIIDDVRAEKEKAELENSFKRRLQAIIPFLALVTIGNNKANFPNEVLRLETAIAKTDFYQCDAITLSYGNETDKQERSAFYEKETNKFYFKGIWYSPRVIASLVSYIFKYLKINNLESLFLVLFLENTEEIKGFLKEKNYAIDLLPEIETEEYVPPTGQAPDLRTISQREYDEETGRIGEEFVYKQL